MGIEKRNQFYKRNQKKKKTQKDKRDEMCDIIL